MSTKRYRVMRNKDKLCLVTKDPSPQYQLCDVAKVILCDVSNHAFPLPSLVFFYLSTGDEYATQRIFNMQLFVKLPLSLRARIPLQTFFLTPCTRPGKTPFVFFAPSSCQEARKGSIKTL